MKTYLAYVVVIAGLMAIEPTGYLRTAFPTQHSLVNPQTQLPVDQFVTHIYRLGVSHENDERFNLAIGAAMVQLERARFGQDATKSRVLVLPAR